MLKHFDVHFLLFRCYKSILLFRCYKSYWRDTCDTCIKSKNKSSMQRKKSTWRRKIMVDPKNFLSEHSRKRLDLSPRILMPESAAVLWRCLLEFSKKDRLFPKHVCQQKFLQRSGKKFWFFFFCICIIYLKQSFYSNVFKIIYIIFTHI